MCSANEASLSVPSAVYLQRKTGGCVAQPVREARGHRECCPPLEELLTRGKVTDLGALQWSSEGAAVGIQKTFRIGKGCGEDFMKFFTNHPGHRSLPLFFLNQLSQLFTSYDLKVVPDVGPYISCGGEGEVGEEEDQLELVRNLN